MQTGTYNNLTISYNGVTRKGHTTERVWPLWKGLFLHLLNAFVAHWWLFLLLPVTAFRLSTVLGCAVKGRAAARLKHRLVSRWRCGEMRCGKQTKAKVACWWRHLSCGTPHNKHSLPFIPEQFLIHSVIKYQKSYKCENICGVGFGNVSGENTKLVPNI